MDIDDSFLNDNNINELYDDVVESPSVLIASKVSDTCKLTSNYKAKNGTYYCEWYCYWTNPSISYSFHYKMYGGSGNKEPCSPSYWDRT